jgi:Fe-S-cluster containining protein
MVPPDKQFYANGLCFECQGSGNCCRAHDAFCFVWVDEADRRRLAGHLGLDVVIFTRDYCAQTDGQYHLTDVARDCRFLQDHRCRVYAARPTQCRTWPFWPSLMNRASWERDVVSTCPGAGKGHRYSAREIDDILWGAVDVPGVRVEKSDPPPPHEDGAGFSGGKGTRNLRMKRARPV